MKMSASESSDANIKRCRYACTFCSEKKIKCDGLQPCSQCKKRHKECVYMTKKKHPSKLRRTDLFPMQHQPHQPHQAHQPQQQQVQQVQNARGMFPQEMDQALVQHWQGAQDAGLAASRLLPRQSVLGVSSGLDAAALQPVTLGATEKRYLQQYMRLLNTFVPLLPSSMIRDAMNPVSFDALGVVAQQLDQVKQAACKAATWAAISMGASISHDPAAETFLRTAVSNLRECFDHPCREAFCAYLVVAEAYCMIGDKQSFVRYVSFADLIRRELTEELGLESEVAMNHIRSQCYSMTKGSKRFGKFSFPDFSQLAKYPTNLYAVSIVDFVLVSTLDLMDANTSDPATARRSFAHYVTLLEPLKVRLEFEGARQSNPIALLVCMCMLGLSMARVERADEAFGLFRSVVDLAESAPYLVCMPLTWHSMSVLHRYFAAIGQADLARRLEAVIRPNASKWTQNTDSLQNLPLTNGVFNLKPQDMKDIVIRDLIEAFARNSTMGGGMPRNTHQHPPSTDSNSESKDTSEIFGIPASVSTGDSESQSHGQATFPDISSFQPPVAFSPPREPSTMRSLTTPVQLVRGLSDVSNISFTCECFGELIDDEAFPPPLFQDSNLPNGTDTYSALNEMSALSK